MKFFTFIVTIIILYINSAFCIENLNITSSLIEDGRKAVEQKIIRNYGGIIVTINYIENTDSTDTLLYKSIQTAYGYPIRSLECYYEYNINNKTVSANLKYGCNLNNTVNERYLDDIDLFDPVEAVKTINQVRYNNIYDLDFEKIKIEKYSYNQYNISNVPFEDLEDFSIIYQFCFVDKNLIEAAFRVRFGATNIYIGCYSKEDISDLHFRYAYKVLPIRS